MRLYHSLWTEPLKMNPMNIYPNTLFFAVSAYLVKQAGHTIVMHTDKLGYEFFKNVPFYDELYVDLNITQDYNFFWAFGKMVATKMEPLGSMHLDGDVLFRNLSLISEIERKDFDLFVQNEERNGVWPVDNSVYEHAQYLVGQENLEGFEINYPKAYNCGLTCFRNQELKDFYLDNYFKIAEKCICDENFFKRLIEIRKKEGVFPIPDLIAEQQILHEITNNPDKHYKVEKLLNSNNYKEECGNLHYDHFCSFSKYTQLKRYEIFLKTYAPETFEAIQETKDIAKEIQESFNRHK